MSDNTSLENTPSLPPTMALAVIEAMKTSKRAPWGALNDALNSVPVSERIIIYQLVDGSVIWRRAGEPNLYDGTEDFGLRQAATEPEPEPEQPPEESSPPVETEQPPEEPEQPPPEAA